MHCLFHQRTALARGLLCLIGLAAAGAAQAAIRIEIEGVDAELKRNVTELLSLERYKDRDRIEPDAVERLYRRVDDETREALRPFGYYEPKVTSSLQTRNDNRDWNVRIQIVPGQPVLLDRISVVVKGPGGSDLNFTQLTSSLPLRSGERLQHAVYERVKGELQRIASTYGYLDARMVRSDLLVNPAAHKADVFIEIESGERYRFGPTVIEQNVIRETLARRLLRYNEGDYFDAGQWLRTQFAFDDSLYFSAVEVTLGERDTVQHIVPVHITAQPARRSFPFAVGYGTDDGARGTVGWINPRINSLGHRLRMQLKLSEVNQRFDTRYDIPLGDPALEKFSLSFLAENTHVDSTQFVDDVEQHSEVSTRDRQLEPSITQVLGRWQRVLSVAATHTVTFNKVTTPTSSSTVKQIDDLIVPGIAFAAVPEGYLGEGLFSRTLYMELLGSHSVLGANVNFLRLDVSAERYFNLWPRWHLLLRGEVGTSVVRSPKGSGATDAAATPPELPGRYRFFAGGDRSVRGFGYDELSPGGLGGRHLITGTVEIERDLPRNLGVAAFYDFGNAFNDFGDPLATSVGLGFRWRLPGLTLGIDVARALEAPGQDLPGARLHLNIAQRL